MKKFLSIIFMTVYLAGSLPPAWTLVDFYWNRDYYTRQFCVNLDAGITMCRASCYLERKLEGFRSPASDTEISAVKTVKPVEIFSRVLISVIAIEKGPAHPVGFTDDGYHFDFTTRIFRPPKS